jgi:acyl-CoA-binding protein
MVIQFGVFKKKTEKQEVLIDFVDPTIMEKAIEQKKEEVKKLSQQQLIKDLNKEYAIKNVAVNEADVDAKPSIDKMVEDIKGELNIKDRKASEQMAQQPKIEEIKKKAPLTEKKVEYTENAKGERTFYKGATTTTYFLKDRMHVHIPLPVYQCEGSGKVVMEIIVNRDGYVMDAIINKQQSQISADCFIEAATRCALSTRFNASKTAPEKQQGKITYIFIAQ